MIMRCKISLLMLFFAWFNICLPEACLYAWNDRTHALIAYMAFQELSPERRETITATLQAHPHYHSYLLRDKPDNCPEDLWVFMRAATWPDYVNNDEHRSDYHRAKWHYVNFPFLPVNLRPSLNTVQLTTFSPNILTGLDECYDILAERYPSPARKAIATAWITHLVADLHQPLHCVNLYNDRFPSGDQGGNKLAVRDGERIVRLHAYWDNVLGEQKDYDSIVALANEISAPASADVIPSERSKPLAWSLWANDSFAIAVKTVYLNGELPLTEWRKEMLDGGPFDEVPSLSAQYSETAKEVSKTQVKLAAQRLAGVLMNVTN